MGLDSTGKILNKELHIRMIVIVNECRFEKSAEEKTKQQVGTLRPNSPHSVTKKNDGIKLGKR